MHTYNTLLHAQVIADMNLNAYIQHTFTCAGYRRHEFECIHTTYFYMRRLSQTWIWTHTYNTLLHAQVIADMNLNTYIQHTFTCAGYRRHEFKSGRRRRSKSVCEFYTWVDTSSNCIWQFLDMHTYINTYIHTYIYTARECVNVILEPTWTSNIAIYNRSSCIERSSCGLTFMHELRLYMAMFGYTHTTCIHAYMHSKSACECYTWVDTNSDISKLIWKFEVLAFSKYLRVNLLLFNGFPVVNWN
jgi:hypothetical protein